MAARAFFKKMFEWHIIRPYRETCPVMTSEMDRVIAAHNNASHDAARDIVELPAHNDAASDEASDELDEAAKIKKKKNRINAFLNVVRRV